MTSRMFDSLQRLPDSTFRRVASTSLTPSLSATLLLVGRGEDEPRVSRRAHSTEPVLPSHMQWMAGSESLEKRNARARGHKLGASQHLQRFVCCAKQAVADGGECACSGD